MRRGSSSILLFTFFSLRKLAAEIAQLVEHNLAKVGVAGPSPVFRSFCIFFRKTTLSLDELIFEIF